MQVEVLRRNYQAPALLPHQNYADAVFCSSFRKRSSGRDGCAVALHVVWCNAHILGLSFEHRNWLVPHFLSIRWQKIPLKSQLHFARRSGRGLVKDTAVAVLVLGWERKLLPNRRGDAL